MAWKRHRAEQRRSARERRARIELRQHVRIQRRSIGALAPGTDGPAKQVLVYVGSTGDDPLDAELAGFAVDAFGTDFAALDVTELAGAGALSDEEREELLSGLQSWRWQAAVHVVERDYACDEEALSWESQLPGGELGVRELAVELLVLPHGPRAALLRGSPRPHRAPRPGPDPAPER